MLDHAVVAIDDIFGEAEHVDEPADHGFGVLAAQGRIDARGFDFAGLVSWANSFVDDFVGPNLHGPGVVRLKICYQPASASSGRVSRPLVSA